MGMTNSIRSTTLAWMLAAAGLHAADGVAPGINHFATSAYRDLARGHGNLIFSPFNIASALSMALAGARGQTAAEMAAVLDKLPPGAVVDQLVKDANTGGNQLLTANGLWVQRDFPILSDFKQLMETQYRAPLSELDFAKNPEQARAAIMTMSERPARLTERFKERVGEALRAGLDEPLLRRSADFVNSCLNMIEEDLAEIDPAEPIDPRFIRSLLIRK